MDCCIGCSCQPDIPHTLSGRVQNEKLCPPMPPNMTVTLRIFHIELIFTLDYGGSSCMLSYVTIFIRFDAHALIDVHSSQNHPSEYISRHRALKSLYYFRILKPASGAKCGGNTEISKLCMHYNSHMSVLY